MVQSRNNPTASEWIAIKREFSDMYLDQNMKLNEIKDVLFRDRGFVASDRQYKMRVKTWKLDRKKIKGPIWHSMFIVMKHRNAHGLSSTFKVPIRGNHIETVRSDRITKQINRDRTGFDPTNLQRAEEILKDQGVEVYTVEEERAMNRSRTTQAPETSPALTQNSSAQWQDLRVSDGSAAEASRPNDLVRSKGALVPTVVAGTAESSTGFQPAPLTHVPVSTVSLPVSYSANHTLNSFTWGPNRTAATLPTFQTTTWAFDVNALVNSFLSDPYCTMQLQATNIPRGDQINAYEDNRRAVMWVGPYIQLHTRREPITADWFQISRAAAKGAFNDMLGTNNRHTFPYCNWMVTVLGSSEQTTLLTVFLTDCCEVIDQFGTDLQGTYGALFHLLLAFYTEDQEDIEEHQAILEPTLQRIGMIWGRADPNYLVPYCTLAWVMLEKSRHQEALVQLRQFLSISEHTMGSQHVVTLNYLTIYARALAETGCEGEAISILKVVSDRLNGCTDVLQAYRYRQLMRLAELQIETNDFSSAESNLIAITQFRTHYFGMSAACTWKAIEMHRDLLRTQQRFDEADSLWNQNNQRYQQGMAGD